MKFATNPIRHYPPHCRRVATLRREITKFKCYVDIQQINGRKMQTSCIFVASHFVIRPQILIFSVFNIASFSRTDCK